MSQFVDHCAQRPGRNWKGMNAHAYTEDLQAPHTLTQPLAEGEKVEQPAIGLFAELG